MMNGEHDILIIDEYLNHEMSPEKVREIEGRIGSDPRFAKKVREVRTLRTGIVRVGLKEKIDRMKELDKELSSDEELERMVKDPNYVVEDPLQMQTRQPINGKSAKRIQLTKRNRLRKWTSIAAGLLILVAFGLWQTGQFEGQSRGQIMADSLWFELDYDIQKGKPPKESGSDVVKTARNMMRNGKTKPAFRLLYSKAKQSNKPEIIHYAIISGLKLNRMNKVKELLEMTEEFPELDNQVIKYYHFLWYLKSDNIKGAREFIRVNELQELKYPVDWQEIVKDLEMNPE